MKRIFLLLSFVFCLNSAYSIRHYKTVPLDGYVVFTLESAVNDYFFVKAVRYYSKDDSLGVFFLPSFNELDGFLKKKQVDSMEDEYLNSEYRIRSLEKSNCFRSNQNGKTIYNIGGDIYHKRDVKDSIFICFKFSGLGVVVNHHSSRYRKDSGYWYIEECAFDLEMYTLPLIILVYADSSRSLTNEEMDRFNLVKSDIKCFNRAYCE